MRLRTVPLASLALVFAVTACSDSSTGPENRPANHTVLEGGVAHASGLHDPVANCTSCHGATLQGGTSGEPSCFTCHGKKW